MEAETAKSGADLHQAATAKKSTMTTGRRRVGFGHYHSTEEEIYVVVRGGGRMKLNDHVGRYPPERLRPCRPDHRPRTGSRT
jgi:oxalate decarboxylase/phosphoglucose isomerase-like protein (cupin superfamily)